MTSIEPIDKKKAKQIKEMQEYIDKHRSIVTVGIDVTKTLSTVCIQFDYGTHGTTQFLSKPSSERFINHITTMHEEFPSFTEEEIKVYLAGLYTL